MSDDSRQHALNEATAAVLATESGIAGLLAQHRPLLAQHAEADAVADGLRTTLTDHEAALRAYLDGHNGGALRQGEGLGAAPGPLPEPTASAVLQTASVRLSDAALGYGRLYVLALRLYEPPLRKLCPEHLEVCTGAVRALGTLVPQVVAKELAHVGLDCRCICPMCGIGACGCVAMSTATLRSAWPAQATGDAPPGFALQAPRAGSPLADAAVQAGERLLAVDGAPVSSIPEIQAAIRKHALGEEMTLRIGGRGGGSREIRVRHVSDYPAA
jgi:hypothetical protein